MTAPIRIVVSKSKSNLTVTFDTGGEYDFPAEYLRVFSPSAEVRGHGRGQEVLQYGKRDVGITSINKQVTMQFKSYLTMAMILEFLLGTTYKI